MKSSSQLKRDKEEAERLQREATERARLAAEQERLEKERAASQAFARANQAVVEKPAESKVVVPVVPSAESAEAIIGLSKGAFGAFDVGLLIAFPVIVGTLMLFFLFPLLGPEFAKSLPPVPLN